MTARFQLLAGLTAALLIGLSLFRLEYARSGIDRTPLSAGLTPATLYRTPGSHGPLVVIAHGFAGSRQLMEALSLTLAHAGYAALAFDFEGHGRNPVPMSGDVTAIEGTTARLIAETRRVIEAGRAATGWTGEVALIGHSMASDIVIRTGLADARAGPIVAISAFSQAITADEPDALLIINGALEGHLREEALRVLQLTDPAAAEGETAEAGPTTRRAVAAPMVEHVGVLYSATTLTETRAWLDRFYDRPPSTAPVARTGGWVVLLLGGIVLLGWSLLALIPGTREATPVPLKTYMFALAVPAIIAPLIATRIEIQVLPALIADYLALHLLLYGALQLAILWRAGITPPRPNLIPMLALLAFALGVFGLALDRYAASFLPLGPRLPILPAIALGAVPFMLADAMLSEAGRASFWRRTVQRLAFLASLILAVALDFDRLMFLVIVLPVIVLFFVLFGLMGRWVGRRHGAATSGLALGVVLAWSLAASFPLFQP